MARFLFMLLLDFETKSLCDLIKKGSYNYALDRSTDILCCAFLQYDAPDGVRPYVWYPALGPLSNELAQQIKDAPYLVAHNAAFDRLIWELIGVEDYGFPEVAFDRWYCSSAQCRVNNLPASLEDAARALNAKYRKNKAGTALIRALSLPQPDGTFNQDPVKHEAMREYCADDVLTMRGVMQSTRLLTEIEHEDWLINEDINERGVLIDVPLALAAEKYANTEIQELSAELYEATDGAVTKTTQSARAAKYCREQLGDDHPALKYMTKYVDGEPKYSVDKEARAALKDAEALGVVELPENVFSVIDILDEGSMSSVRKFKNMALRADEETHRVHGAFIYAGASQTLRYASRGLQIHNFPSRGLPKDDAFYTTTHMQMLAGHELHEVMTTLKSMLRYALKPAEGNAFIIGDWSGIEARVLPWLSASMGGQEKLDKIASGVDVYMESAELSGYPDRRDVGKVLELACGYQGGLNAFLVFAKSYGVVLSEAEIKSVIKRWRRANSWVVRFWAELEEAAKNAIRHPNKVQYAGRLRYLYTPNLMDGSLLCILPDDSVLTYPKARLESQRGKTVITALKASVKMKADAKEWPRESLYGGRLAGNATQGTAAALLRLLLANVHNVVAHVHDEVVLEVPMAQANHERAALERIMCNAPEWATGLPLDAKPEIALRYKK